MRIFWCRQYIAEEFRIRVTLFHCFQEISTRWLRHIQWGAMCVFLVVSPLENGKDLNSLLSGCMPDWSFFGLMCLFWIGFFWCLCNGSCLGGEKVFVVFVLLSLFRSERLGQFVEIPIWSARQTWLKYSQTLATLPENFCRGLIIFYNMLRQFLISQLVLSANHNIGVPTRITTRIVLKRVPEKKKCFSVYVSAGTAARCVVSGPL